MERFRRALFRYSVILVTAGLGFAVGACGQAPSVAPENPASNRSGSDSVAVAEAPDNATAVTALDSLFSDYDLARLAWHPPDSAAALRWVDSTLAALSVKEKIGQLFIIHLPQPDLRRIVTDKALDGVRTYGVGGFLVSRLLGPEAVFKETQRLQQASKIPLFFAADYERGAGRFNNVLTELPSNMALGATRDTVLASAAGRLTALESRAAGINLLFAPVVDVNNNPDNPIINIRSFGEDPELVASMAAAFVREAQRHGILTTLKHFPGHGNTSVDSHAHMGVVEGDVAGLDSIEFRPYRRVLGAGGAAAVMSAHLWVPVFDAEPLPATFSRRVLHDVLRDSLGFDGLVITDDIQMGALRDVYRADERIVRSLVAGADVILTPVSLPGAVKAVETALRSGALDPAVLDRSVRRILRAKAQAGLHRRRYASEGALAYLLETPRGAGLARTIAAHAVTLLKTNPVLPLDGTRRVVLVQVSTVEGSESIAASMDTLAAALQPVHEARLGKAPSTASVESVLQATAEADAVVLALYLRLQSGRGKAGLFPYQEQFVRQVLDRGVPVVLVTFGHPYAVTPFADAEVLLIAYEQSLASVEAVINILLGRQPAQGALPISVFPYPYGHGLQ